MRLLETFYFKGMFLKDFGGSCVNRMSFGMFKDKSPTSPISVLLPHTDLYPLPPSIFGCLCFVHNYRNIVKKFDHKSIRAVFLGYSLIQKGYKCLDPTIGKWFVSWDITFIEHVPYFPCTPPQEECDSDSEEYSTK